MFKFLTKIFDSNEKQINRLRPFVEEVKSFDKTVEKMSFDDMKARVKELKSSLEELLGKVPYEAKASIKTQKHREKMPEYETDVQKKLFEFMPEVFAMVREIARRKVDNKGESRRHWDNQLMAGKILAEGKLAEVNTGEGKTQTFHLPLALYGLTGRGAHCVTVNDYLSRRDGEYAGHFLSNLGLTVGIVTSQMSYKFIPDEELKEAKGEEAYNERMKLKVVDPGDADFTYNLVECSKKEAYGCDVVYGTNNEFGFDYLRDNMVSSLDKIAQRELYFAIVDEVDSILIDEARTPLIISAPAAKSNELYKQFARLVPKLEVEKEYTVDEKAHSAVLTDEGIEKMEKLLGVNNLWEDYQLAHHLDNALKAYTLYKRDDEYLVRDGQVLIIDQFTGRVLPGRRYSEGLHQAIEAKENVEIKQESVTLATITFQNFFRLYKFLAGASGTVETEAEEFYKIYNLDTVVIPTNVPVIRKDKTDRVYKNQKAKFEAVVEQIKERHKIGQPILVGTTSVEKSEYLASLLERIGIEHQVLNAKYHEKEAHIVSQAGKKGAVTIATNMAGRGTDIKLGGARSSKKEFEEVFNSGGLYVIGTERHEARRIDNQLRGRSGRHGEPGESRFYVALDDEIMRIQGGQIVQRLMERTNIPDDMPIESGIIGRSIENAQKRMEGYHFDIRKHVVEYDDVMNQQREIFYTRRRKIIELNDKIKRAFEDKEKPGRYQKIINETRDMFTITLDKEVENIVNSHFFVEREDSVDRKKLLDDFLDLADDDFVLKSIKEIQREDKSWKIELKKDAAKEILIALVGKLDQQEIIDKLKLLAQKMYEVKEKEVTDRGYLHIGKIVMLQAMDQLWTDHLEAMQDLREGIGLRGMAQRDPLVEYKNEAYDYFTRLLESVDSQFAHRILKIQRVEERVPQLNIQTNVNQIQNVLSGAKNMTDMIRDYVRSQMKGGTLQSAPVKSENKEVKEAISEAEVVKKVGRNDPCPCGSGKKYKKCHGS